MNGLEDSGIEHVDADQRQVGPGMLRFFLEADDPVSREFGNTELLWILDLGQEELATLGHVRTEEPEQDVSDAHGYLLEQWHVRDESPQGLRLVRASGTLGRRYTQGQLMAVRPHDAKHFMLAQVRWLMQGENGDLHAGLKLMPGLPSGIGVRPTGLNAQGEDYVPALALSAVQALNAPATLILPSGWYKPKRVIEVYTGEALHMRLAEVIERGTDFERVTYEPAT